MKVSAQFYPLYNQKGFAPILILVAVVGVLAFIALANFAPFKGGLFSSIFPKDSSFAASPYNPGDTDGDLDVDIFDYNSLLTNFGQAFNDGDFDGNNKIDIFDYNSLLSNFGKKYAANPSPQPVESPGNAIATLNQGLVGYWKLDETSVNGTAGEIKDASGNNNHGIAGGGTTVTTAKYGNGASFDGVDDVIDLGSPDSLDNLGAKDFTMAVWINPDLPACGTTSSNYNLFTKASGWGNEVFINCNADSKFRFISSVYLTTRDGDSQAFVTLQNNTWYHLTIKYNGTTKTAIYFLNGQPMDDAQLMGGEGDPKNDASANLIVGDKFKGKLDDIRIYNRALSHSEIIELAAVNPDSIPPSSNIAIAPEPEIPNCTDHDKTKWHPLVEKNPDGTINCTYGHEHHDDPNAVNDIFGAPSAWYGGTQSISYPWQTYGFVTPPGVNYPYPPAPTDPAVIENNAKHNGYKWFVKKNLPCIPFGQAPHDGCFKAYRLEVHHLGTVHDSNTRFHSFSLEAQIDYHGQIGLIRGGGWMDTGYLGMGTNGGTGIVCPPIATNPPSFQCLTTGSHRGVGSIKVPAPNTPHANPGSQNNWYGTHQGGIVGQILVEDFGPVDYFEPTKQYYYPEGYKANNSLGHIENMSANTVRFPFTPELQQYVVNDFVNYKGYQDRHGNFVFSGCTQPGTDCVPFEAVNMSAWGQTLFNRNVNQEIFSHHTNHDVMSPVTGKSLIQYPN